MTSETLAFGGAVIIAETRHAARSTCMKANLTKRRYKALNRSACASAGDISAAGKIKRTFSMCATAINDTIEITSAQV